MAKSAFLLEPDHYTRHLQPIKDWLTQTAWHASKRLNKPFDICLAHLERKLKSGELKIDDPTVLFFYRKENGDREKKTATLTQYITHALKNNLIIAATGTTYLHPSVKASPIVGYLDINVKQRSIDKKKSQKYEHEGNLVLHKYFHNSQDNKKRANNSVSGGFVAEGSVIKNISAHSTLTSTTASIASVSNASNERVIGGNRHYYKPDIIKNNIASICTNSDYRLIDEVIAKFGLTYPTADDALACIKRSSDKYFRDTRKLNEIHTLLKAMSPSELAAFVYTGDLYHLRKHNEAFIRGFIQDLSRQGSTLPVENAIKAIWNFDEQIINYAHQINLSMMRGIGKEYAKLTDDQMYILYNTCQNIQDTIEKYKLLIQAFFLTTNHPATIATIQDMAREPVVLSDTDSTMFSTDDWVLWYFGEIRFEDCHYAVGGSVMYIATQAIAHILAHFSANMNVEKKRLHTLSMKPEYVFPVFAQTAVAKHYYTAMAVKEGDVYQDIKMEIKGVHMKDSTVPKNITKGAADEMERIIRQVMAAKKIPLREMIDKVIAVEQDILNSVRLGETRYLKYIKIKDRMGYKAIAENEGDAEKSNYRHYVCWKQCFEKHYGAIAPPPYQAVSIPLNLPNKTAVTTWLASLENRVFAQDFANWLAFQNMTTIGLIHLPIDFCNNHGVPPELTPIVDAERIALTLTRSYRNILESLGYFIKTDMLVSMQEGLL